MLRYVITTERLGSQGGWNRGETPSHADIVRYFRENHNLTDPDAVEAHIQNFLLTGAMVPLAEG